MPREPAGPPPDGVPFKGAKPLGGLGAAKGTRAGTPSASRRPETGALRRIRDTGAMRAIMDTNAMRTLMDTTAMQILRERYAGRGRVVAAVVFGFWIVLVLGCFVILTHHGG